MDNRKLILTQTLSNKKPERVPVGFWYHYTPFSEHCRGLSNPSIIEKVINGHKEMYDQLKPDFLKIMSDGFFGHPSMIDKKFECAEDLKQIKSVGPNHPWIRKQIDMVKELLEYTHHEVISFYSVFSPLSAIRLYFFEDEDEPNKFLKLFMENTQYLFDAANEIEKDLIFLIDALAKETDIDGIYYSVQEVQDKSCGVEFHEKYVRPSDVAVLDRMKKDNLLVLLHICGWGEFTNNLELYRDYPSDIVNWATHAEKVSLKEGKKLFPGKVVLGGFNNNPGTLLYTASDAELAEYVNKLLDDCGSEDVIIGADCTVDPSVGLARLNFVRQVVEKYFK